MKRKAYLGLSLVLAMALVLTFSVAPALAKPSPTIFVSSLLPDWSTGVFSAYVGPPAYGYVSPGVTANYLGLGAGIIKAGINIDADGHYWDEGLFAFQPNLSLPQFAKGPVTYDVVNETGTNPVWMTIEVGNPIDRSANLTYQFIPSSTNQSVWHTVDVRVGTLWQLMDTTTGNGVGPMMTLAQVAAAASPAPHKIIRVYLRLGMGDSYNVSPGVGTVGWVDKVVIGTTTYDFIVK